MSNSTLKLKVNSAWSNSIRLHLCLGRTDNKNENANRSSVTAVTVAGAKMPSLNFN